MTGVNRLMIPVRKWSCVLLLCHLCWTLDRVRIVDCKIAFLNTPNYYCQAPAVLSYTTEKLCFRDTIDHVLQIERNHTTNIEGPGSVDVLRSYRPTTRDLKEIGKDEVIHHNNTDIPISPRILSSLVSQLQVPTSATVPNELCRNHSRILLERIQRFDMWALKMLDSTAKLPSGILSGNINQYGDFDQCLSVEAGLDPHIYPELEEHNFKGKYCLALIDLDMRNSTRDILRHMDNLMLSYRHLNSNFNDPGHRVARFSTVNWGFCIPSSCTSQDLEEYLRDSIQSQLPDRKISLKIKVDANMCYIQDSQPLSLGTKLTIALFGSIIGLALIATWFDSDEYSATEGKSIKILRAFSLKRNLHTILRTDKTPDDISCLHGIRALNALGLVLFHKSVAFMFNPISNRTPMAKTFDMSWTTMGRTSIIFTDTFILMSGLLTAYSLLKDYEKHKKINMWRKYVARYVRFTPNLLAVILFCTFIIGHLGSGPQWNLVIKHHSDLCQKNMWQNLLYVHNFFGFENMCLTHTHQLAIDMQLYIIAPIFIYILWKNRWIGLTILMVVSVLSTILRYTVTYNRNLSTIIFYGISISQLFDTANFSYILPTHRITVYLMGIFMGYLLQQIKSTVILNRVQVLVGWSVFITLGLLAMLGPYHMSYIGYQYNPTEAAYYNAFSPIMWGSFIGWAIFTSTYGYAGYLGDLLCWTGFKIFSQISYAFYLTQFPIFFYNVGLRRIPEYYKSKVMLEIGEVSVILLASLMLTLLVDIPFQEMKRSMWKAELPRPNVLTDYDVPKKENFELKEENS